MAPIHPPRPLDVGFKEKSRAYNADEAILSDYQWDEYKAISSEAMCDAIEAHVLKDLASATEDGSSPASPNGPSIEQCQRLLRNDRNFRRIFLHCWKVGAFDDVRQDERYLSLTRAGTLTPASAGSWRDEDDGYMHNILTPATPTSTPQNMAIQDSIFNNVEGDFWQINYFNDHHKDVAEWLCSFDYRPVHYDVSKQRQKSTGEWFLHSAEFRNWLLFQDCNVLWCPGIPGVGKTVLASLAINNLIANEADSVMTFVYFDYKLQKQQNQMAVLGALARQIYEAHFRSAEASAFESLYQSHRAKKDQRTLEELQKAIAISLAHFDMGFIVVDALDEYLEAYSDRKIRELLVLLLSLSSNIKLLVTSRIFGEMETIFSELGAIRRPIHAFEDDIQQYIKNRITSGSFSFLPSAKLTTNIVETVTKAAKGRFLLAKLHMNSLAQHSNAGDVRDVLDDLPDGIDETYADVMERIESQTGHRKDLAMKTLMWIAYARRSLWIKELQHALATRPGAESTEDYLTEPSFITAACAGLVIVEDGSDVIRFVHVTVQEYFATNRHQHFPLAEQKIARTCIDYLNLTCFNVQGEFDWGEHPFYDYAALEWGHHAQNGDQELSDHILQFLSTNNPATSLCLEYILYRELFDWYCDDGPGSYGCGVFIAIYHQQDQALSRLLENTTHVPSTRESRNPFLFAARLGRIESACVMLQKSQLFQYGLLRALDRSGRDALTYAAGEGHEEVVQLLLDRKGPQDYQAAAALLEAARRDHAGIVRRILQSTKVDVNSRDHQGSTALSLAAKAGHTSVIKTLLEGETIDPDTRDCDSRTPLSHAAEQAHNEAVKLLLSSAKVDVNSQDNQGRTILSWAAGNWSSHQELLQRNPVLNRRQKPESSALLTIKLLIEQESVDIDLADKRHRTPISYANQMGYSEVVSLLEGQGTGVGYGENRWNFHA